MYKKIAFIYPILFFGVIGPVYSQSNKIAEVDSVVMTYYQRCLKAQKNPIVLSMSDTLFQMAGKVGDKRMQAVALCTKVDYYYYGETEHQRDNLLQWVKNVQLFAKQTNQPKYYYFVWSARLINFYLYQKEYNTALAEANKMLKEAQNDDYKEAIADCYSALSNIYIAKGLSGISYDFVGREIELYEKYDLDRYNISMKYGAYGRNLAEKGMYEEAEEYFDKGLKIANTNSQRFSINLNRIRSYLISGQIKKADELFEEAQERFSDSATFELLTFYQTAHLYYMTKKDYVNASKALQSWEDYAKRHNMKGQTLSFLQHKANLYNQMGQSAEAVKTYEEVIEMMSEEKLQNEEIATSEIATLLNVHAINMEKKELEEKAKEKQLQYIRSIAFLLTALLLIVIFFLCRQQKLNKKLKRSRDKLNEKNQILLKAEEDLRRAKERVERNSRMKDIFIQNISHEIRTPLNSIVGFSTILSEITSNEKEEVKLYVDTIEKNSQLLLQMIDDIIQLSDLDRGRDVNAKPILINDCGESLVKEILPQLNEGVEFSFIPLRKEVALTTDRQMICQVLRNLLSNAAKFTYTGSIIFSIEKDEENKEFRFIVTDTGIGIPLDKQERVFERFVKLNEFSQGTGLGLCICRLCAEKLGGYLTIDKKYTDGTRFVFGVPE